MTSTRPSRFFGYLVELSKQVDADLLHTEKILADRKTFYLDLKQNSRGMVVKITEDVSGNRDTIMVPAEILGDFIAALNDIKATADEQE
ncbi:MAG: RNA-binding protein [Luteolibacter sp.]